MVRLIVRLKIKSNSLSKKTFLRQNPISFQKNQPLRSQQWQDVMNRVVFESDSYE